MSRRPSAAAALLLLGVVVLTGGGAGADPDAARPRVRAAGGQSILAASSRAAAVVAGTISNRKRIDDHAWTAALLVDDSIAGPVTVGNTTKITWEELSTSRQVRFDDGERVLVVLEPIPNQSIWTKRFSQWADRADYIVASRGDAFLRSPDGNSLHALLHYLAMAPHARGGAPGAIRLAEIAASGDPALGAEALELLDARKDLKNELGDEGAAMLLQVARSEKQRPELRAHALRLAAGRGLPGVEETALALSKPGCAVRAEALQTLTTLPSGLTAAQKPALLDDEDAAVRLVGIEANDTGAVRGRLVEMTKKDPSPQVRLAAGTALVARGGTAALPDVLPLLDDADATVRVDIAQRIGELGSASVEPLRSVIDKGSERAALAAVVGLTRAGRDGSAELVLLAHDHPNKKVQTVANLALGRAPDADKH